MARNQVDESSNNKQRWYVAIDLKSFYASVECVERKLNPLDACLVVADNSRTDKTICLAVSPALKSFGVGGRPRLFEVVRQVRVVNSCRGRAGHSSSLAELTQRLDLAVDYIVARPRMRLYVDYSERIRDVYLRYVAPEDMHVYSIDEVFIDVTDYLYAYRTTAHELAIRIIRDVLQTTGITATVGIGTNMYLCKVAMDIVAKKMPPDKDGVRIAELDEMSYRRLLWSHRPLTDFWRVGRGIATRLEASGIYTMGDLARRSLACEEWFYREFGVNAELLIDHAWGHEPVTMSVVRAYRPTTRSISSGQVLTAPYPFEQARTVIREMADVVALQLVDEHLMTNQIVLTVGYDVENLSNPERRARYNGRITVDHYGREVPYHSLGTHNFKEYTSSSQAIIDGVTRLFDSIANPKLLIRRLSLSINRLQRDTEVHLANKPLQLDLFSDTDAIIAQDSLRRSDLARERRRQEAILNLRQRFGKNTILKGFNYAEGATQRQRNQQIGGHQA